MTLCLVDIILSRGARWKRRNSQKGSICTCGCTSSYARRSYTDVLSFKRHPYTSPHQIIFTQNTWQSLVVL